jgi:DUF1680 family protein
MPTFLYTTAGDEVWAHMYAPSSVSVELGKHGMVSLFQRTEYPFVGSIELEVVCTDFAEFGLRLRIPGWCEAPVLLVNGRPINGELVPGTYAKVRRRWRSGDLVHLELPMPVRLMESHQRLTSIAARLRSPEVRSCTASSRPITGTSTSETWCCPRRANGR